MSEIKYPVGRVLDGTLVHITRWRRGQIVRCFECDQELVGRLPQDGVSPAPHFAHKADAGCNGESALHKAAKAAIVQAFACGTLHSLIWDCPRCNGRGDQKTLLTDLATLIEERRPCEDVQSDVLGFDAGGTPRLAIEVVVTHDIALPTLERYAAIDLDVFSFSPSWRLVSDLASGAEQVLLVKHRSGYVDADRCHTCQQILRAAIAREAQRQRAVVQSWWCVWGSEWRAVMQAEAGRQVRHEEMLKRWWMAWSTVWRKIGEDLYHTWQIAWISSWRSIAATHQQPYVWWRAWCVTWNDLSTQHVALEATRQARQAADRARAHELDLQRRERMRNRHETFWPTWIVVWRDIGSRASGARSQWQPICPRCRQDLGPRSGPDHVCLRAAH